MVYQNKACFLTFAVLFTFFFLHMGKLFTVSDKTGLWPLKFRTQVLCQSMKCSTILWLLTHGCLQGYSSNIILIDTQTDGQSDYLIPLRI